MKEIRDIIAAYDKAAVAGMHAALATVVKVEGSSYRREGARMLITEDGRLTGAISGGCLEGDALRKALHVMQHGHPALVTYDTTDEDDAKLGLGLGCNGILHILIEPVNGADPTNVVVLLKVAAAKRQRAVLVTKFSPGSRKDERQGCCFVLTESGITHSAKHKQGCAELVASAAGALSRNRSAVVEADGFTVFVEVLAPQVALVIFGAGNDALPLTQMAAVLGWDVTVVDGRPGYATADRFPSAGKVVISKPGNALKIIIPDARTAVVLMTHNYNYDLAILRQLLLGFNLPYIGTLGPKKKLLRMMDELAETGCIITPEEKQRIFGPTGLDIGALTAEEIALSMLAEIQCVLSGKAGGALRERVVPIHELLPG